MTAAQLVTSFREFAGLTAIVQTQDYRQRTTAHNRRPQMKEYRTFFHESDDRVLGRDSGQQQFFDGFCETSIADLEQIELAWRVVLAPGVASMKFRYDKPAATARRLHAGARRALRCFYGGRCNEVGNFEDRTTIV